MYAVSLYPDPELAYRRAEAVERLKNDPMAPYTNLHIAIIYQEEKTKNREAYFAAKVKA